MQNKENYLTEGPIFRSLMKFAWPFFLASLLQAVYGATDLFVVGQFVDASAVSAVSVGSQILHTLTMLVMSLTTGGTVLIGQYWGAKDGENAAKTVGTMVYTFIVIALLLTVVMIFASPKAVELMQTPESAAEATNQYVIVCSAGMLFITAYNVLGGIMRGLGDSKTPLIFVAAACVVNVVLDFILVAFCGMGTVGTAYATVAAQAVSVILFLLYLKKKGLPFEFSKKDIELNFGRTLKLLAMGTPLALQSLLVGSSFLIIMAIINGMGLVASASLGVSEKFVSFAMLVPVSVASAIAAMVAQNIGANQPERARKCTYYGIAFSLIFGISVCLFSQWHGDLMARVFTNDPAVIAGSALYFKSFSLDCICVSIMFCLNAFFIGCGHTLFTMSHSLIAAFCVRAPAAYFLSRMEGATLYEVGFAAPMATTVSIIICLIYLKSGRWGKRVI